MKLLFGTLILGAGAVCTLAQTGATPARVTVQGAMATDIIIAGVTKNAPFTADESGETVRIMPDGNRIVQSWTGRMARNSDGRIRRDITSGQAAEGFSRPLVFGGGIASPAVVALGTGDGKPHVFATKGDAEMAAAARAAVAAKPDGSGVTVISTGTHDEAKRVVFSKIEATVAGEGVRLGGDAEAIRVTLPKAAQDGKFQTSKESLGTRDFGGVQADGVRLTTTFAPGAVGNEREIVVTTETWWAKELGVLVYSKRTDPRTGEQTYQMSNIVRSEPDPSLFPARDK